MSELWKGFVEGVGFCCPNLGIPSAHTTGLCIGAVVYMVGFASVVFLVLNWVLS